MSKDILPPQSVELEEAVLGALLIESEAYEAVCDILQSGAPFYKEAHGVIYDAIKRMTLRGHPIDILTVTNELKSTGHLSLIGGAYYISQLTNRTASATNIEFHARIIVQNYIKRLIIDNSRKMERLAHQDTADAFDLLGQMSLMQDGIDQIIGGTQKISTLEELAPDILARYFQRAEAYKRKEITGCPTGFIDVDEATGGWQDEDMVIVAARPSMGKTAMMIKFVKAAVKSGRYAGLIFSAEMRKQLLADRILTGEARDIDGNSFRHGRLTEMEEEFLKQTVDTLKEMNIYIDDTAGIKPSQMFSRIKRLKRKLALEKPGMKLLVCGDYIGLFESDEKHYNREEEISKISRQIKGIAKRTHVPFIVLAQMNRQVESRGGAKRPQLSDLRDSGAIEQDADTVIFLHRPEYYGIMESPGGGSTKGVGEIIIAKQRNGPVTSYEGQFPFFYDSSMTHITDPALTKQAIQPNPEFTKFVDSQTPPVTNFSDGETDDLPF